MTAVIGSLIVDKLVNSQYMMSSYVYTHCSPSVVKCGSKNFLHGAVRLSMSSLSLASIMPKAWASFSRGSRSSTSQLYARTAFRDICISSVAIVMSAQEKLAKSQSLLEDISSFKFSVFREAGLGACCQAEASK